MGLPTLGGFSDLGWFPKAVMPVAGLFGPAWPMVTKAGPNTLRPRVDVSSDESVSSSHALIASIDIRY